jgi:carbonic anhydrase/acetyltransferase-like protein (isoleucine patch superfamily)
VGYAATLGARVFLGDGAVVGNLATLGDDARVEGLARVGRGADLGAGAKVRAGAAVGPDVQLGAGAEIGAEAKVRRGADVGAGARIAAQASVGRGAEIGAGAAVAIGAVVRAGGVVATCADLGAGDVVGRGETFSEGWACALPGEDPASALASCKAIRDGWPAGQPAPTTRDYFIDPDGGDSANAYAVRCEMDTDQGGWTLVGSFVNTDGVVRWSRPAGYSAFQDTGTFGTLAGAATSDFKSAAWSQVGATDLLVTDAYGWVSYDAVLGGGTIRGLMSSVSTCQTTPLVPPGDPRVDASHATLRTGAMLALFAGDPNSSQNCGFSGVHSDSATLALSGAGCGAMGAGQWGTNYNSGMDWHMTFNAPDLCIACDGCGNWNGYAAVTSATHNNNAGAHDNSTWAMVWVR